MLPIKSIELSIGKRVLHNKLTDIKTKNTTLNAKINKLSKTSTKVYVFTLHVKVTLYVHMT